MQVKKTARKLVITPVVPTVQQTVEAVTFQATTEVAASLATKALVPTILVQLKQMRTNTMPNTCKEQFEKEKAQIAQDMVEE